MLAVLNRYKIFLIILTAILLVVLAWLVFFGQQKSKIPTRGVFVLGQSVCATIAEGGAFGCSR